jgi:probable phosphoglycerate mutase
VEEGVTIAIARHGQTESNLHNLWSGEGDDNLNETGKLQAVILSKQLMGYNFELVISSDKKRAVETAKIISSELGIPFGGSLRILRDRSYGSAEGLTSEQIFSKFGVRMTNTLSGELDSLEGAEKVLDVYKRVHDFINTAVRRFEGKKIVVVSHGAFVRAFYALAINNYQGSRITNCSHFIVKIVNGRLILLRDLMRIEG